MTFGTKRLTTSNARRLQRLEGRVKTAIEARKDAFWDRAIVHLEEGEKELFIAYVQGERSPEALAVFTRWKNRAGEDPEARKLFSKMLLAWNCDRYLDLWRD